MRVPERITVQLVDATGEDLSDVIVQLTVSTGQRNPRHIRFPKTDAMGRASLDRSDFLGQFDDATDEDLMGSWGTIADASPTVEVTLYDPTPAIVAGKRHWVLGRHEKTRWHSPAAEYAYHTSCRNLHFTAVVVNANLHETAHIELPITAVSRSAG